MTAVAVTNTTCLIDLDRIARLDILRDSFDQVVVPPEVLQEFGAVLRWCEERPVSNRPLYTALQLHLGRGEAAAIALAAELDSARVVLDDRKARRMAYQLNLPVLGTVGVLLLAKRRGVIPAIAPLLDEFDAVGFRLGAGLWNRALEIARES